VPNDAYQSIWFEVRSKIEIKNFSLDRGVSFANISYYTCITHQPRILVEILRFSHISALELQNMTNTENTEKSWVDELYVPDCTARGTVFQR